MKKNILTMMAVVLVVVGITACGGNDKHPFRNIAEHFINTAEKVKNNRDLMNDESFFKDFEDSQASLAKKLYGKTILTEVSDGLGFEIVSNEGKIGEGEIHGDNLHIPINIDLRSIDESLAYENYNDLAAVFYDDEGIAGFYKRLELEQALKSGDTVETDTMSLESAVKKGNILHNGLSIDIEFSEIQPFVNISKIVIEKYDYNKSQEIENRNLQLEREFVRRMRGN